ncbi:glutamate cyclase domain-containing protein [Pollutimonas bauzanensis]|uniref:glutamate cyclase domain-containing protein n=1 Tax=Pollutimonas bauzanensis TaxID=658167 RepID=UPI003342800D
MNSAAQKEKLTLLDAQLDRLTNIDIGQRGVEHLSAAARGRLVGQSPVGAAASMIQDLENGSTVLLTTGSPSRAWVSPTIGENDGPAGAAVLARALSLGKNIHTVVVCEATLIPAISAIFTAAGLSVLPFDDARRAVADSSLAVASFEPFPVTDAEAHAAAEGFLNRIAPALLISTERVGRATDGVYYSMRGIDYGMGRSRIDILFEYAMARQVKSVCIGDGGNEIGMGAVADAVTRHVKFGEKICATTSCDILVTAACSNWGCTAITAALAARIGKYEILHTPELESRLLHRGVDVGLINSMDNVVDANVDGISAQTHLSIVQFIHELTARYLKLKKNQETSSTNSL